MKLRGLTFGGSRRVLLGAVFVLSSALSMGALAACDSGSGNTSGGPIATARPVGGAAIFAKYCNTCHPGGGRGAGPSLIQSAPNFSDSDLQSIVRHGRGRMPGFGPDLISYPDLDSLVVYIRGLK